MIRATTLLYLAAVLIGVIATCFCSSSHAAEIDPDTKVYCDRLWMRVHAADCPALILKEKKKTMTLAEADKAGWRIGQSGQSGRNNCCLVGYKRKHPPKKLSDDTIVAGNDLTKNYKHIPGCHRYVAHGSHDRWPIKEAKAKGFSICKHCIERGPSVATVADEQWKKHGLSPKFVAPEGWKPKPYSPDKRPSGKELEILIQETLAIDNGIRDLPYTDPIATVENFMIIRFFFPMTQWLDFYQAYRATGDKRIFNKLLESARHYNKLSRAYPSAVQKKASDPEGLAYMLSMAMCARITLQTARKYPGKVSKKEIAEAEEFLKTMVSVLKPVCEGDENLDPKMGIPKKLADDFRYRAFNRALNGIGTIAMAAAALEDLQAVKKTKAYQPTIDRYRKVVREYIKHYLSWGHMCDKVEAGKAFFYPYSPRGGKPRMKNGCKRYKRAEDSGHYSHALQGLAFIYEATPELGVDDDFMTAVANAIYYHSSLKKKSYQILCPGVKANARRGKGGLGTGKGPRRFYLLHAFKDGMIAKRSSGYGDRVSTLRAQYMKALRKDRTLIHMGEKK